MDETQIRTLEEIERFLCGAGQVRPVLQCGKDDAYAWIERTLVRFGYMRITRKGKGIVRRYIMQLSGYSRQQITRLISQYRKSGRIRRRQRTVNGFEPKYTRADIQLLAMVDRLVDDVSGTTAKAYCKRAHGTLRGRVFDL